MDIQGKQYIFYVSIFYRIDGKILPIFDPDKIKYFERYSRFTRNKII